MRCFWKVETTGTVFLSRIVRILLYCEQKIVPHLSVEAVQVIFGYPSLAIREGRQYVQSQSFTSTAEIMAAMKEMFWDVIQQVMEVEMDEELGRERCQRVTAENSSPNYRNAYSRKTVKTPLGEIDIRVPRDRKGNYEPKIIGKYDRNVEGMEEQDSCPVRLRDESAGYCQTDQRSVRCGDISGAGEQNQ